ncbi:hypothetical protein GIW81_08445 [Hyphomicrobium sp. xq]|uniref:Uncharacterized protein n=1 Tax=Hyphomicrobium album TaxID=2665159 RepID=A0A6I3KKT9_9HYPH|nr:hypothetical protein [Hyphomicrobium album]MTD94362.1 hypothetical protein [Hyphomicrobium album]
MRGSEKQKSAAASPRRNRYCAGAKLSEHKFLRILHGYAEGLPVKTLEPRTHVTAKTIRSTYGTLRAHLPVATRRERARFSHAGVYLFEGERIAPEGRCILASIERTRRFGRYIKRHAPRLSSCEDEHLFLLEKAVRIFCALDLRGVDLDERLLAQIGEAFTALHPRDPLQKLADFIPGAKPHAHPELRLYEDYRRYLLKNPLRGTVAPSHVK